MVLSKIFKFQFLIVKVQKYNGLLYIDFVPVILLKSLICLSVYNI